MKHLIPYLLLIISTFANPLYAQNDKVIEDFSTIKGVTSVFISETMLQLVGSGSGLINTGDIKLDSLLPKIKEIQILTAESKNSVTNFRKSIVEYLISQKTTPIMQTKEDTEQTSIYFINSTNLEQEYSRLILFIDEEHEITFININGTFTLKDLMVLAPKS